MAETQISTESGSAEEGAIADQYPPPGPENWVTDGYPHRETDPRNWPTNGTHASKSGSSNPLGGRNGAEPAVEQRAPRGRLKEFLDRWLR